MLAAYHALPYPLRVAAASLRGFQLRAWRYGRDLEALIAAARERETWSGAQWDKWRQERLAFVLHRAATQVPYYAALWNDRRRNGDHASWEHLENWPVLDKEAVRSQPRAFLAKGCVPSRMFHEHTSGTTGKPLDLWWSRATVREWYALMELRCRLWHAVSRHDRWAILGGQLVTRVQQRQPPFWVWNQGLNQLYMSSYHLAPDLIPAYLEALRQHRIHYLWGYTSSLCALAREIVRSGRRDLQMAVVITNAEPLAEHQRALLAEAFQCPVRETYGMAEIVAAASECEAGRLHVWPEAGIIELDADSQSNSDLAAGEIIATGLLNADMPLIRYRTGDRGRMTSERSRCPCKRTLPSIAGIEGRTSDLILLPDGRRIFWLNPVLYGLPVQEAQFIQEDEREVRLNLVPGPGYLPKDREALRARTQARLEGMRVVVEEITSLPRTTNGKLRAILNRMPTTGSGRDDTGSSL